MGRCSSCDSVLTSSEMFRNVEVEDGRTVEIVDNTCNACLSKYVYGVDFLDSRFYACSDITECLISGISFRNEESS